MLALAAIAATTFALVARATAADRHAAMVVDGNSGQVLHAQSADEPRFPASLTKMMTLYITFELMQQGRMSASTLLKITDEAAGTPPSKLGLAPGSEITLIDAIKAIVTKSANDMAVAIAEHIAGSEAKFAILMTRKAHQLGMRATTFRNSHGLPDSAQLTTARDMLTLALRLKDDFPKYYPLFGLRQFTYAAKTYRNHNTMLGSYPGMDGLKTGYTTSSGFNLIASVNRSGKYVVAAVLGGSSASARNAHMRVILDRALARASTEKTRHSPPVARLEHKKREAVERKVAETAAPALIEPIRLATKPPMDVARPPTDPHPSVDEPVADTHLRSGREPVQDSQLVPVEMAKVRPIMVTPRARQAIGEPAARSPEAPPRDDRRALANALARPSAVPLPAASQDLAKAPSRPRDPTLAQGVQSSPHATAFDEQEDVRPIQTAPPMLAAPEPRTPILSTLAPQPSIGATPAEIARATIPARVSPPEARTAQLARPSPGAAVAITSPPAPVAVIRGMAPSSLQAQAERLRRGGEPLAPEPDQARRPQDIASAAPSTAPAFHLRGPDPMSVTPAAWPAHAAPGVAIQVGAYATQSEAQRQLEAVQAKSRMVLKHASPLTQPVQSGGRQLFRARFVGFDSASAAAACTELRRQQIDCLVAQH